MARTRNAMRIVERMIGKDAKLRAMIEQEELHAKVAKLIFDTRTKAGLTQKELAKLVGTTQSVVARLEDADYDGHSLGMLQRIAAALNKKIDIRLVTPK